VPSKWVPVARVERAYNRRDGRPPGSRNGASLRLAVVRHTQTHPRDRTSVRLLTVLPILVSIALVVSVGLWVAIGIREMRGTNAEKFDVLKGYEERPVVIVKAWGRSTFAMVTGVLTSVDKRGITVRKANGRDEFITLAAVRALDDNRGRCVADWGAGSDQPPVR
jgi:hypothetical protein